MRKSRFMVNLMVATALGLASIGCGQSSNIGSIQATDDIRQGGGGSGAAEQQFLREYMIVGQRGLETFSPEFGPDQSGPPDFQPEVVAEPGDALVSAAFLYELVGIAEKPRPNANILGPGGEEPTEPLVADGTVGFHQVYADPTGNFVIGINRAKNRGFPGDEVGSSVMQIFSLRPELPFDQAWPPVYIMDATADPTSILNFAPDQGDFVSGVWSSDARFFYLAISNLILTYQIDGNTGGLTETGSLGFPAGVGGTRNNAMKLLATADNRFLFAVDNANGRVVSYSRNANTGALTEVDSLLTVSDPRGATLDRSGRFLYVAGRSSGQLAGYRIQSDGSLSIFELFDGFGPIPFTFGLPLGDVAANPQDNQLFMASYEGVLQAYQIDPDTGSLTAQGSSRALGLTRNLTNIEVEPTGKFVLAASEHDYEAFQDYVTIANGFSYNEAPFLVNIDEATNELSPFSPTPMFDLFGRVVYALQNPNPFAGNVQVFRVEADGSVRPTQSVQLENPYGITFFQKVLTPPGQSDPSAGSNEVDNTRPD